MNGLDEIAHRGMIYDNGELVVYQGLESIQRIFMNEINGVNMRDGIFCECCVDVFIGIINIKEVICERVKVCFLGIVVGEFRNDEMICFGILLPGGGGKESVLLLHI